MRDDVWLAIVIPVLLMLVVIAFIALIITVVGMLEIIAVLTPLVVPIITAVLQIMTLRSQKKVSAKVDELKDVSFMVAQATAALAPERKG